MRALLAWIAFVAGVLFIVVDVVRLSITGLFLLGVVLLVVWAWGIDAFRASFWIAPIDGSHPDALGSLDLLERHGVRRPDVSAPAGDANSPDTAT
ncbi:hypothetical protein HF576_01980 [Microbacterium sp. CFH 90308]|uniref:Uncharacterized protein n=1 Tax=Microbacterium salsuginis TaxID=2722803 RepID=A0ABX1K8C9_9MICO|nr:hypothetical protein [Microbacterium sp. CFH 90308]NLP82608.1 hypothetical protein [Microbacterium sp. CFH 90308]